MSLVSGHLRVVQVQIMAEVAEQLLKCDWCV